jgi:hypothetical protein
VGESQFAEDLPPLDRNASCPKCGHVLISVIYHRYLVDGFPCHLYSVIDEHLCRVCRRCQFGWCEAPIDVKPPRQPAAAEIR